MTGQQLNSSGLNTRKEKRQPVITLAITLATTIGLATPFAVTLTTAVLPLSAVAADLSGFATNDLNSALKTALTVGSDKAIASLGKTDGFLNNPKVRIALPDMLNKSRKMLGMMGMGQQLDQLEVSMNRAAEGAIPLAKTLVQKTIKEMSVQDAQKILQGGDTAVTLFFREKTEQQLFAQLKPIVAKQVSKVGVAEQYNQIVAKGGKVGLSQGEGDHSIESHVTQKALDGLFNMIAAEEQSIRANPAATGSQILKKVFGQ